MSENCQFWILYGKHTLFYCGLDKKHKGDHQIAIPKNFKENQDEIIMKKENKDVNQMPIIKKLIKKLKEALTFPKSSDYIYVCLDCKEEFDGIQVELFIKHQIDFKHWEASKYKKEK